MFRRQNPLMMRGFLVFVAALWLCAPPALAQRAITLEAAPVPIVAAEINGRPVRLEVDLRFPSGMALSTEAAARLGVRRAPFAAAEIGIEGGASIRARIARPRIAFERRNARAFSVIAPAAVSARADGVIGPSVLPYDTITIQLRAPGAAERELRFPLADADEWVVLAEMGGETLRVSFDLGADASIFNRPAARAFDNAGLIIASGALREQALILGLSALMQPVETELRFEGLPLAPAFARTNAPLLGATEPDAIVVTAEAAPRPPARIVGRAALAACSSITMDRRASTLTLRCV